MPRRMIRNRRAAEPIRRNSGRYTFEDVGMIARLDTGRAARKGVAEVVFCLGKTDDEAEAIIRALLTRHGRVLATRASRPLADRLAGAGLVIDYDERSKVLRSGRPAGPGKTRGLVGVLCAGTSDLPVAEEAARTAEFIGTRVIRRYDVGVAGLHRLLTEAPLLRRADALVVAAGMEGALPSVVAGLTPAPVVAVPTSVGYGASFGGVAALLAMLNSCAPGVVVVNIDNGFGAGYAAAMMARRRQGGR